MGEVEKNPTIEIHLLFQDGVRLGWKLKRPISQVEIMRRMGIILAETDNDIDILLFETEDAGYVKVEPAEGKLIGENKRKEIWASMDSKSAITERLLTAQLAHDKARMVVLPSEDELRKLMRKQSIPWNTLGSFEIAHELLKLLKGE